MARRRALIDRPIATLMSRKVVSVGPHTTVAKALERTSEAGTQHLIVCDGEQLAGVVCRCDLERARPETSIGELARKRLVTADPSMKTSEAAALMRTRAVGCLPILSGGLLLGVVTRSDLLRAGVPREELGGPCAACGSQHALAPYRCADDVPFCRDCLECRGDRNELGNGD